MSLFDIEKSIIDRLDTGTGDGQYNFVSDSAGVTVPVYYENTIDDRSEDVTPRIEFYDLGSELMAQSKLCTNENEGSFQISVFVDSNSGTGVQKKILNDLRTLYSPTSRIDLTDTTVYFRDSQLESGRADGNFWRRDITFNYYCWLEA